MDNLARLYTKINNENISVFDYTISFDTKAVTIETQKKYGIFVDRKKLETIDDEFMVVSHEYGHCKSGATHKINSKYDIIEQHEYRADRQSIIDLLPIEMLEKARSAGCKQPHEIADYLNLPEKFIILAFKHYKNMELI